MSKKKISQNQLTLLQVEAPAKISQLPEIGKAWMERNQDSGLSIFDLLQSLNQSGWYGKMSPAHYTLTAETTSLPSFEGWMNAGIMSHGECLTLNISEFHSAAAESSLWQILETETPQTYYLSAKACRGLLRRGLERGNLPPLLAQLLQAQAELLDLQDKEMS